MNMRVFSWCCTLTIAVMAFAWGGSAGAQERIVTVGTAGVTGVYYPAGGAICRLVNRGRKDHNTRCVVESTGGSINNLEWLRDKELDVGIVQSDWLYHAYNGSEVFKDSGPNKKLRTLFALHSEPFTIIARANAGIKTFDDLKGKRISLGSPGSGMRATMDELVKLKGWNEGSFKPTAEIKTQDQAQTLCSGKVDAIVYAFGHPNAAVQQITSMCDTKIVGLSGDAVDKFIEKYPFYAYTTIPGGLYMGNPDPVKTFGVKALVVTTDTLDDAVAYEFTRSVFDNLDNFKTLHPVFASLDAKRMIDDAQYIAELHSGAMRYFREKGLVGNKQ